MIVRVAGRTRCGPVVDLRGVAAAEDAASDLDAALAAAIRGEPSPHGVVCPPPGPVHEHAGRVRPGASLSVRTALAAAGRSRGLSTPSDDDLAAVREELAALEGAEDGDGADHGRGDRVTAGGDAPASPADADVDRLRERVAELRGRVRALEDAGEDPADARERLRSTAGRLSELTTRRVAAVERRERRRERRDRRERRLRLQDRLANLERSARAHLVERCRGAFADAVTDLAPAVEDPFEADPVVAALGVLRVASVSAPVVLAVDRFEDPGAAAEWLDAPVIAV